MTTVFYMIVRFLPLLAACLQIIACSGAARNETQIDMVVHKPADVKQLRTVEESLTVTPEKAPLHPDFQLIEDVALPFSLEYRLGPGDVIEVVYHIRYEKTPEDYRLEVQDKISVHFPFYPQFSTTVLVRTDGKITLPLLGDVSAASRTPQELAAHLNKEYSKYMTNPSITISLEEFNVKVEELKKAITTAPRGQSKIAPVTPDGRIAFPILGNMQAEGYTLSQLEEVVNKKYGDFIRNLKVSLILLEIHYPKIFVLGEVEHPGAYDMQSKFDVLKALVIAGGVKKTASLSDIMVFRNDGLERPMVFKVDVEGALKKGEAYAQVELKAADVIYIPKGKLDNMNDMIEKVFTKGLYGIIPFSSVYSINMDAGQAAILK